MHKKVLVIIFICSIIACNFINQAVNIQEQVRTQESIPVPILSPTSMLDFDQIVLDLFDQEEIGSPITIFRYPKILKKGDIISSAYFEEEEAEGEGIRYLVDEDSRFYFVDYFSDFRYAHPVEYIIVQVEDREIERLNANWWPILNDQKLFFSSEQREETANIVKIFSGTYTEEELEYFDEESDEDVNLPRLISLKSGQFLYKDHGLFEYKPRVVQTNGTIGDYIIINGIAYDDSTRRAAMDGVDQAERALRNAGYNKANEFDVVDEVGEKGRKYGSRTKKRLSDWLKNYGLDEDGKLDEDFKGRNLTIFWTSHGNSYSRTDSRRLWLGDASLSVSSTLRPILKELDKRGIRIKIIFDASFGGKMAKGVRTITKVSIGSSDGLSSAQDVDKVRITNKFGVPIPYFDLNPEDTGPEFISGYWEDYRQIHERLRSKENDELREWFEKFVKEIKSKGVDTTKEELILYAAYFSAVEKDLSTQVGFYYKDKNGKKKFTKGKPYVHGFWGAPKKKSIMFVDERGSLGKTMDDVWEGIQSGNRMPDWIDILLGKDAQYAAVIVPSEEESEYATANLRLDQNAGCREGNSIEFEDVWFFDEGTILSIVGTDGEGWYKVSDPNTSDTTCWINVGVVEGDASAIPIIETPDPSTETEVDLKTSYVPISGGYTIYAKFTGPVGASVEATISGVNVIGKKTKRGEIPEGGYIQMEWNVREMDSYKIEGTVGDVLVSVSIKVEKPQETPDDM